MQRMFSNCLVSGEEKESTSWSEIGQRRESVYLFIRFQISE